MRAYVICEKLAGDGLAQLLCTDGYRWDIPGDLALAGHSRIIETMHPRQGRALTRLLFAECEIGRELGGRGEAGGVQIGRKIGALPPGKSTWGAISASSSRCPKSFPKPVPAIGKSVVKVPRDVSILRLSTCCAALRRALGTVRFLMDFRFSRSIMSYAVWACHRFALTLRDVEDLFAERGVIVSYESIRVSGQWFGTQIAAKIRRDRPAPADKWHLDEVVVSIRSQKHWLWSAVDANGDVLEILVQSRRNARAAGSCDRSTAQQRRGLPGSLPGGGRPLA